MFFFKKKIITFNFIQHNKKYFKKKNSDAEILVEFNNFKNTHVPISYLSECLSKKFNAKINAFFNYHLIVSSIQNTILNRIKWKISSLFFLNNFGIYSSFGCSKIFKPNISKKIYNNAKIKKKIILKKIKDKNSVLDLKFDNILVGDLIYDTYLKKFKEPTIDVNDETFKNFVIDFYKLYEYWKNYFNKNKVKSVVGVHSPYSYGLILRIAIKRNIPTYVTSNRFIYKLTDKMKYMHCNFKDYRKLFKKLDKDTKKIGKKISKKRIKLRLNGIAGAKTDLITSEVSSFNTRYKKRLIKRSKRIKVLISPHDFFDAVHIWGKTFFTDFYEWLNYLGEVSNKTSYDWYIKNRPNHKGKFKLYQPYTSELIKKFVKKYRNIKLLPNNYPHNQIVSEGIDFVLTCYGSVGMEYANYKIPVINASKNNPHINFDFNINPKNLNNYKSIIKNLGKYISFKKKINLENIYEYYFMRHIYYDKNWLIEDLPGMIKDLGGYDNQSKEEFYEYWMKKFSLKKHEKITESIKNFVSSNQYGISILHTKNINNLKNN